MPGAPMQTSSPFPSTLGPRRSTCGWAPSRLLYKTGQNGTICETEKTDPLYPSHLRRAPRTPSHFQSIGTISVSLCLCGFGSDFSLPGSLELPQESEKNRPFPECRFCNAHLPTFPLSHLRPSSPGRENAATKGAGTGLICMGPRSLGVRQQERRY